MEKCKYCQQSESIKNSHIIPKFIFDWLKETSATGSIRNSISPNKRVHDGVKVDLLCTECEKKFSTFENSFKRNIFSKIANYRKQREVIDFTSDDKKCVYSIIWRVLAYSYYYKKMNEFTKEELEKIPVFLDKIKKAVESGITNDFRTYIVPLTESVVLESKLPVTNFMYYDRCIGMEPRIYDNYERLFLYIKLPFILIVCELISCSKDIWIAPQLELTSKIKITDKIELPQYIHNQITYFYTNYIDSQLKISKSQQELILNDLDNADSNCGTFKSFRKGNA